MKSLSLIGLVLLFALVNTPSFAITCDQIKQMVQVAGSVAAAEQYALAYGYTRRQINYIKRKCLRHG